jgi:hypothetical protein
MASALSSSRPDPHEEIKEIKGIGYGLHDLRYFELKVKQAFTGRISTN